MPSNVAKLVSRSMLPMLSCVVSLACGSESSGGKGPLVEPAGWELVPEAEDPFASERPAGISCDSFGFAPEDFAGEPALFVDTALCNYATGRQPSLRDVPSGSTLRLRLFHDILTAPDAAEAVVVVAFDGRTVWERRFAIPGNAELLDETWQADRALDQGGEILFHVHNHGPNNWALIELATVP